MGVDNESDYVSALHSVWAQVDNILGVRVTSKDCLEQPIALRHPYVFYLGHLPAFSWQQVRRAVPGTVSIDERFEEIFLRGIDPDVDDPTKCHSHSEVPVVWPSWEEVVEFRSKVRNALKSFIGQRKVPGRTIRIIAEHDAMHAETLCYMLAQGAVGRLSRKALKSATTPKVDTDVGNEWVSVKGGLVETGSGYAEAGFENFKWDNELGNHRVHVHDFQVQRHAVTVAQFIQFIDAGGYGNESYWNTEDWAWVVRENRKHPASMRRLKNSSGWQWQVLTIDGPVSVNNISASTMWPVYLSLAEARAYARWIGDGVRLPTEAEWMLYSKAGAGIGNHENELSDTPHDVREGCVSVWGVVGAIGNGWELTTSQFHPFNGFTAMPDYEEYSADFFDGRHYVLKGTSNATHRLLCRSSFRNFYQARYGYVFAKFRLVR